VGIGGQMLKWAGKIAHVVSHLPKFLQHFRVMKAPKQEEKPFRALSLLTMTSLLGCCHEVRRVLPYQRSLAGTPPWCVVSGLTVVCAWATPPVSLFGRPPEYLN
jgi:hypothetical protein